MGTDVTSGTSLGILGGYNNYHYKVSSTRKWRKGILLHYPETFRNLLGNLEVGHVSNQIPSKLNFDHHAESAKVDGAGSVVLQTCEGGE